MIRVAVVEEHDIFRRGVVSCLAEEPAVEVVHDAPAGPVGVEADVAVVSQQAALGERFACPLVVCGNDVHAPPARYEPNVVLGVLPRSTLTAEQLVATVRAGAAGLRVQLPDAAPRRHDLDDRSLEVLRLLSRGADTHQISRKLSYSERTVKMLIADLQRSLGARNRTHAVAEGIRNGFI